MHAYVHICTHFCVRDFIVLILSSPILTLLVSLSFLILFTLEIQELIFFCLRHSPVLILFTLEIRELIFLSQTLTNGFKLSLILPFMVAYEA